jgi:hypothetical protein
MLYNCGERGAHEQQMATYQKGSRTQEDNVVSIVTEQRNLGTSHTRLNVSGKTRQRK